MAITSVGYDGTVNEAQWAGLAPGLGAPESVEYGLGATVLSSPDRGVRIAAGAATAHGVRAVNDANVTIALNAGTRWDTIVLRRNWQATPGGATTIAVVQGTGTRAISANIEKNPGVIADQPLYLARVQSGSSVVTEIVDVRAYASKVLTVPSLVAVPGAPVGTVVISNGRLFERRNDASGSPVWAGVGAGEFLSYTPAWSATTTNPTVGNSTRTGRYCRIGDIVFVNINIVIGSTFSPGNGLYSFGLPFPPNSASGIQLLTANFVSVGVDEYGGFSKIDPATNNIIRSYLDVSVSGVHRARALSESRGPWGVGSRVHISGSYHAAPLAPV